MIPGRCHGAAPFDTVPLCVRHLLRMLALLGPENSMLSRAKPVSKHAARNGRHVVTLPEVADLRKVICQTFARFFRMALSSSRMAVSVSPDAAEGSTSAAVGAMPPRKRRSSVTTSS